MTGALLHLVNHATMKACLFLVVGGVLWRTGVSEIAGFAGMGRRLPLSMAAFSVAALSLVGLPPMSGFFSKWYLMLGAIEEGALALRRRAGTEQPAEAPFTSSGSWSAPTSRGCPCRTAAQVRATFRRRSRVACWGRFSFWPQPSSCLAFSISASWPTSSSSRCRYSSDPDRPVVLLCQNRFPFALSLSKGETDTAAVVRASTGSARTESRKRRN